VAVAAVVADAAAKATATLATKPATPISSRPARGDEDPHPRDGDTYRHDDDRCRIARRTSRTRPAKTGNPPDRSTRVTKTIG
jgi:hypothetical protein